MTRLFVLLFVSMMTLGSSLYAQFCDYPVEISLSDKGCGDAPDVLKASCIAPKEVPGALKQPNYNDVQRASDIYSWEQLIALNWPAEAGKRGEPAPDKSISAAGVRVWETWKEVYEVYLPDGRKPKPWNASETYPGECRAHGKVLMRTGKVDDVIDATLQALPADGTSLAELKDQNGRLVRYEIRLNKPLFDFIVEKGFYNGEVQAKAKIIDFPAGSQLVKAAWREVDADDAPFFFTKDACVCEDDAEGKPVDCTVKKMGLAGFHLMTKTDAAPQWIWSTYEQMDNVASLHPAVAPLNDPECGFERCPPNKQTHTGIPTQLTRVIPIPNEKPDCERADLAVDDIVTLNSDIRNSGFLKDSFLRYYDLVGTQWPVSGTKEPLKTVFSVRPELLANSVMESFSQNTSSCMGCHVMSRTLNPHEFVSADFSFTLNNAKPLPKGSNCTSVEASESCNDADILPPPKKPETPWERKNWAMIQLGYDVTTRTYEVVGSKNVGNRLHCESCHLNGGGNPDASWWVDMDRYYPNKKGTTLQERINGCFERSMNGHALCSDKKACDANPIMNGLTTYMQWLSNQYKKNPTFGDNPPHGFDGNLTGNGDYARGREIYTQKCAFCHNNSGQGRYESHTYFRPALWGPDSFNACAGMSSPGMLANFLHHNMPYTSGGLLTPQESNDLATYIDDQCRPGKGGVGPNGEICSLTPGCADGQQVKLP